MVNKGLLLLLSLLALHTYAKELNAATTSGAISSADDLLAKVKATEQRYADLQTRQNNLDADMDSYWLIINAALVLLMQAGFALYEAGTVLPNAQASVFFKNVLLSAVVAITWWTVGYALAYGDNRRSSTRNGFIGNGAFILVSDGTSVSNRVYGRWFFEWTYALIPTTIVTMALAERLRVGGIIIVSIVISGFVYPVIAHWTWSKAGWLSPFVEDIGRMGDQGMFDFAGSGTIFLCGGAAGLAATIALGPRKLRFENPENYRVRNKLLLTFGALLIWFTAFAYTTGRTLRLSGPIAASSGAATASKVLINTVLGAVGGFFGGWPLYYLLTSAESVNVAAFTDSFISGLAAVSAGVALVEPWAALTIGFIGGLLYVLTRLLIDRSSIDDSVNGFAIFSVPGVWGLISVGILATEYGVIRTYPNFGSNVKFGLFYHGGGDMLWAQIVGAIAILAWSFVATFIILRVAGGLFPAFLVLDEEEQRFGADRAHYTEYYVTESFADGSDAYVSDSQSHGHGHSHGSLNVPRWLLVDYRNEKEHTH